MDITDRLQNLMHLESAAVAPGTTATIEVMRMAKAEIERLRDLLAFNGISPDAVVESAAGAARTYEQTRQPSDTASGQEPRNGT